LQRNTHAKTENMGCSDSKSTSVESQKKGEQSNSPKPQTTTQPAEESTAKTSKPKVVLYYFDFRGRAEAVRLILHYGGIAFEDKRLTQEEWGARKEKGEFCGPFGQMPWAEIDGEIIAQSKALLRFAAREAGTFGETDFETAMADSLVDSQVEILEKLGKALFSTDDDAAEQKEQVMSVTIPEYLGKLEKTLGANDGGKGYFVGKKITHADFAAFAFNETLVKLAADKGDLLESFPLLKAHSERIMALPQLKEYLESRPDTQF